MNAKRHDPQRNAMGQGAECDATGAALKREMMWPERTGAFRENEQLAVGTEHFSTLAQRGIVLTVVIFILLARHGNAVEEQPREGAPNQLGRDQKILRGTTRW